MNLTDKAKDLFKNTTATSPHKPRYVNEAMIQVDAAATKTAAPRAPVPVPRVIKNRAVTAALAGKAARPSTATEGKTARTSTATRSPRH